VVDYQQVEKVALTRFILQKEISLILRGLQSVRKTYLKEKHIKKARKGLKH
jgi:hypothetical protein